MTKKQIEKKAKEMANKYPEVGYNSRYHREIYAAAMEMAEWLLCNQWVSVEDELPPKGEIVIAHYGNFSSVGLTFACWDGKGWKQEERDITHWMPIPLPPMEGGLL